MREYFISFDVHCAFTEVAVVTARGERVARGRCATKIPDLTAMIQGVPRRRYLTFEEGPMAGWLYRHLREEVDELVVCEPRRNHLVAKDSDKDDAIDAEKLAHLFRGGYLKKVHQAEELDRALFKQHVGLYHDRVRRRVSEANVIMAQLRRHGVFVRESRFGDGDGRRGLLARLPESGALRANLELLWQGYDRLLEQEDQMRRRLVQLARKYEPLRRFVEVPGVAWVRAATFFAYVDTPARFSSKSALWRYTGIGLERSHSGQGPVRVQVAQYAHRLLRGVLLGAAATAIRLPENPFHDQYVRWTQEQGISARNARRNVARSLAATLWGMWKNGTAYRPEWVAIGGKTAEAFAAVG
jgi:transposase